MKRFFGCCLGGGGGGAAGACATSPPPAALPPLQIIADNPDLRAAAAHVLKARGAQVRGAQTASPDALRLRLREEQSAAVDTLAADGSIGSRLLQYSLWFAADGGKERRINRNEVIYNNANALWANVAAAQEAVFALREDALAQMAHLLEAEAVGGR